MKNNVIKFSLAALLATTCASPLAAASFKAGDIDLTLGASIRFDAGYQRSDLGDSKYTAGVETKLQDDKTDFFAKMPSNSRLKFGAAYQNLNGYVEVAVPDGGNSLTTRHAYMTYTNGAHSLLVGQTDVPILTEKASQVLDSENGLAGYGDLDLSRRAQIKYTYKTGNLSVETALLDNYVKNDPRVNTGATLSSDYQISEATPAVAARLVYKDDHFMVAPGVYWQSFKYEGNKKDGSNNEYDDFKCQTYVIGLDASAKFAPFKISTEAWYGQNVNVIANNFDKRANSPSYKLGTPTVTGASTATGDLDDVSSYGVWLMLSSDIGKNTLNVGAGYESSEVETGLTDPAQKAQYRDNISTRGAFVNVKIPIQGGFFIQPEIAYYDHGDDANKNLRGTGKDDLGSEILAGVHFQYDF